MRYAAAIRRLFALQARGMRMGIDRMRDALRHRELDPAQLPPMVHVAGTNGKGSVSAMIASALQAAGYRTGLFSSPHLHRFTERIRIQGRPLGTGEAARRIGELLEAFDDKPAHGVQAPPFVSFFELSTLMAAETFRDHGCDVVVMEAGLGGRLDATNALPASLSVITRIAYDHQQYLGDTLAEIAREKAGIIKPGVPVIAGSREPEALQVIAEVARAQRARLLRIDHEFRALASPRAGRVGFEVEGVRYAPVKLSLPGQHQHDNAACAVAALAQLGQLGFRVPKSAIARGLTSVRWPARLEYLPGRPGHLLDAAHNPDGCAALAEFLASEHGPRRRGPRVLVFGVMADKDYAAMLAALAPQFDAAIYARPNLPRAQDLQPLADVWPGIRARGVTDALARARVRAGPSGLVVVAGSIFLVAEARARLLGAAADPLIRL